VVDFTLSGNYTIGNLKITPELRMDKTSVQVFSDNNTMDNSLSSFVLGAVYEF